MNKCGLMTNYLSLMADKRPMFANKQRRLSNNSRAMKNKWRMPVNNLRVTENFRRGLESKVVRSQKIRCLFLALEKLINFSVAGEPQFMAGKIRK